MCKNGIARSAFIVAIAALFFGAASSASAASMRLSPQNGTYHQGQNFSVGVFVNADAPVNAVSGVLTFPTANLEVIGVNKNNSVVDLWVQEPSFSNSNSLGNVQFEGVVLNPGFVGQNGRIVNVVFRVKNVGVADVDFLESAILANDGLGTSVGASTSGGKFVLVGPAAPAAAEKTPLPKGTGGTVSEAPLGVVGYWEILPSWIKISILGLVGLATLLLFLILLGFGIIVLIWIWNQVWRRRETIEEELESLPRAAARFLRKAARIFWSTEQEVKGDLAYGISQLKKEVREAKEKDSIKEVIVGYWASTLKIFKRFATRDYSEDETKRMKKAAKEDKSIRKAEPVEAKGIEEAGAETSQTI